MVSFDLLDPFGLLRESFDSYSKMLKFFEEKCKERHYK